jgi:CRP-like cAMP-binding protein
LDIEQGLTVFQTKGMMYHRSMYKLTKHIRSIVPLSDHDAQKLERCLVEKRFPKKAHIYQVHDYPKEVFFVLSGCVRTYVFDPNGVEHNISFSTENWWFGDLQSFINRTPASYQIQSLEETIVLAIQKENWDLLLDEIPGFVHYTRILFRNTMFAYENRILQNLSMTAEERYNHFLKERPDLYQRIPQKHIASYLGITPEFLSMLRSKKR